jgi:uncharacterized protein (UPF0212 family)
MLVTEESFKLDPSRTQERIEAYLEIGLSLEEAKKAAENDNLDFFETRFPYPDSCPCCGKKVTVPFVYWNMSIAEGGISLHLECASHLGSNLLLDVARDKVKRR